jgi:hypothetical protein
VSQADHRQLTGCGAPEGRFRQITISTVNRKGEVEIIRLLSTSRNGITFQIYVAVIGAPSPNG